jgi:transposase
MASLLPSDALTGRPRRLSLREITDAVLYIVRAGCAWRLLPHDFPAWQSVYYYFNKWKKKRGSPKQVVVNNIYCIFTKIALN